MLPPIFIISLRNSGRRNIIKYRMDSLKLPFTFFDAIYGKDLTPEELDKIDYKFYPERFSGNKILKLGEIGCAMSHIKLYEYMVEKSLQEIIILEDDAIVSQEFERIIKDVLYKIPKDKEIIFFEHGKAKSWFLKRNLVENYKLVKYRSPSKTSKRSINRTTAYFLTLDGAKKLLKHAYPIRMPADFLTGSIQLTKLSAYGVEPPCVFLDVGLSEIDNIEKR